jgi:serine O-acetyltransferase
MKAMSTHRDSPSSWTALLSSDRKAKANWLYGSAERRNIVKLVQATQRGKLGLLAMIFNKPNVFGNCIIGRGTEFGPGFVPIHRRVVINGLVRGGHDIEIEHHTISAERGQSPLPGDDIFVGARAKIHGSIRIDSGVRAGANAVIVKDVSDNVAAVGVPASYIPWKPGE